jgi:hypothetical protein
MSPFLKTGGKNMTIAKALAIVEERKPNFVPQETKIEYLSSLDHMIKENIIDKHEGGEEYVFNGYDKNTPLSTELLIKEPYDEIYVLWLLAKIDYYNDEMKRYNNSMVAYNAVYSEFVNYYNRTHMPTSKSFKYF